MTTLVAGTDRPPAHRAPGARSITGGGWLHLRARRLPWTALALVVLSVLSWEAAQWLASRPYFDGPRARPPVAALAPLVAAVLVSATLIGADVDLERSTPRPGRRWRIAHAALATLVAAALLAAATTDHPQAWGACALVRNTAGLTGLVLASTTVLPAALTWAPALAYSFVIYLAAPRTPTAGSPWWAWLMQPGGPDPSWISAGVLLGLGLVLYGRTGPPAVGGPQH